MISLTSINTVCSTSKWSQKDPPAHRGSSKSASEYLRMENPSYKNHNIDRKYLKNVRKNQFLKVKNSLLELEKDFIELKDRQVTIKREKVGLFFKTIIVSIDVIDKFEQKEMKKIKPIKNSWYN